MCRAVGLTRSRNLGCGLALAERIQQTALIKQQDALRGDDWGTWRWMSYHTAEHAAFETIVLLVVLANIVTLALYDPLADGDSGRNLTLNHVETGFLAICKDIETCPWPWSFQPPALRNI